jgi:hypothetical protein
VPYHYSVTMISRRPAFRLGSAVGIKAAKVAKAELQVSSGIFFT